MISLALVALAVLIAMPLGYAATKPGTFRVQRATRIDGMFINMDRMIGADFEAGLARLKAIAEEKGPA